MWILLFFIISIIGISIYIYVSLRGQNGSGAVEAGKQARASIPNPPHRPDLTHRTPAKSRSDFHHEMGSMPPEHDPAHGGEDISALIQDGIQQILPVVASETARAPKVLHLENVDSEIKKNALGHIRQLRDFKSTYSLYRALDDPNADMTQLSKNIVMDPVLSGRILRVANSAAFGMSQHVNSIGHALMVIGTLNLRHILYQDGIRKLLASHNAREMQIQNHLWEHATLTSVCALHIHGLFSNVDRGTLFTLGLLHDVGKFVLMRLDPLKQMEKREHENGFSEMSLQDEQEVYGIDHALLGRMIFEEWGFSDLMIRIAEMHHAPSSIKLDYIGLDPLTVHYLVVLSLANQFAKLFATEEKSTSPISPIDPSYSPLTHREKILSVFLDGLLSAKIRKAKALA